MRGTLYVLLCVTQVLIIYDNNTTGDSIIRWLPWPSVATQTSRDLVAYKSV